MPGLERLQEDGAVLRGQPAANDQRAVVVPVPVEVGGLLNGGRLFSGYPPVGPQRPLELRGRQLERQLDQARLVRWIGYPSQRPHLGERELPARERRPDRGQPAQAAGDPDVLSDQFEPAAGAGVDVRGQAGQLLFELREGEPGKLAVLIRDNTHVGRLVNESDGTWHGP